MKANACAIFLLASLATANPFPHVGRLTPPPPVSHGDKFSVAATAAVDATTTGSGFFTQLLDHDDPSKGTFQQRFFWNSEFWAGPGSPVVLFTPGEVAADDYVGYLYNDTITGFFAQEIKGASIVVEHRYWGESSPYDNLTTENLQLLTVKQAIVDFVNIAKTIDLPFDTNHSSNSDNAPWVFSGGSYSGALAAWTESTSPGTFWAYHASSAPVEAIEDFWQYFVPIQEGMPANCSKDVTLVIDYVDNILLNGTAAEKTALKAQFGFEALQHDDDFASALPSGLYAWQSNSFYTGYSTFYQFCDAVENVVAGAAIIPDENGVGLEKALAGYANWVNTTLIPGSCGDVDDERSVTCWDSYNTSSLSYTDYTVDNDVERQWFWMLCNEPLQYWQDGAPTSRATIVSRLVNPEYWQRQCGLYFPTENGYTYGSSNPDNNVTQVNNYTQGWNLVNTTRLTWTNGQFDPWRSGSVSSEFRPDGPLASTAQHPVNIIPGGFHCSDLILDNGAVNAGAQAVIDTEVAQIVQWISEYPAYN